jgi:hypothetical protein
MASTVLSVGSVVVSTTGGQTGKLLQSILNAQSGVVTVGAGVGLAALPTPPAGAGPFELIIEPGYTGSLTIPNGYAFVINGATADSSPLVGSDPNAVIVGNNINYSGPAKEIVGTGSSGNVSSTGVGAVLAFGGGNYTITATGANDTVQLDTGSSSQATVTGANSTIDIGSGNSVSGAAAAADAAATTSNTIDITSTSGGGASVDVVNQLSGTSNLLFVTTATEINESGGSATVVTGSGGIVTLNATGGSALVFDHDGGNVIHASTSTEYVTAVSVPASTYDAAAGGADTIFASTGIDYSNASGTASTLFFLGGAGVVTVSAAAAETVFGGSGGGSYSVGATSFEFFGGGGADTVTGGSGDSSVLAFGAKNENLTIVQAASTKGNTIVSFGDNDSINAANAASGNIWQVVNESLPAGAGGTFTGNSTLVGSSAGGDTFVVYINSAAAHAPAHTVDIANWQASDVLFIADLGNNEKLTAADLAAVTKFNAGGSASITLSDGTTIDFTGSKPTTIAHV